MTCFGFQSHAGQLPCGTIQPTLLRQVISALHSLQQFRGRQCWAWAGGCFPSTLVHARCGLVVCRQQPWPPRTSGAAPRRHLSLSTDVLPLPLTGLWQINTHLAVVDGSAILSAVPDCAMPDRDRPPGNGGSQRTSSSTCPKRGRCRSTPAPASRLRPASAHWQLGAARCPPTPAVRPDREPIYQSSWKAPLPHWTSPG